MSATVGASPDDERRSPDRAGLGFAGLLGVIGALVLFDAARLDVPYSQSDPVGPRTVPVIVAALLLTCALVLAIEALRGRRGEAETGDDIDLSAATDWRIVAPLVAVFVTSVLVIDILGWVLTGAILFWGSARALGSRHPVRDFTISLTLSLVTFYGFYSGLGILLPAGVLDGVL